MTNFDNKISYYTVTGTVLSTEKNETTDTTIGDIDGTTNLLVNSTMTHEVWIKTYDDKEIEVIFYDVDVPLRKEQTVTVIYLENNGVSDEVPCVLINHNNQRWYQTMGSDDACVALQLCGYQKNWLYWLRLLGLKWTIVFSFLPPMLVALIIALISGSWNDFESNTFLGAFAILTWLTLRNKRIQAINNGFEEKLLKIIDEVCEKVLPQS
ncbi:MAG: hypothetical protein KGV46_02295 [Pasteurella sp.]|nr:hypothetical protein [Pasteurella sp.]